jgi:hypothetical protein
MRSRSPSIQQRANALARKAGYGPATTIVFGPEAKVLSHVAYGYCKYTTGEYVSNAYRHAFGWKNTYYQPSLTTVMLPILFG